MQSFTIAGAELVALQGNREALEREVMMRAHEHGIEPKCLIMDFNPGTGHQVLTVFGEPSLRELEASED
jgi:hypothetical protein